MGNYFVAGSRMAHMERKGCMDGIVRGLEHKKHRPVVDGIVTGVPRKAHLKDSPDLHKVSPSATQSSEGVFGAGRTPEGDGNAKMGGMRSAAAAAHKAAGLKRAAMAEKHAAQHNY